MSNKYGYQYDTGLHVRETDQEGKELASNTPLPSYTKSYGPVHELPAQTLEYAVPPKTRRNPMGLSPLAFGAIIAIVTAVIVGGVVGGATAATLTRGVSQNSASFTNGSSSTNCNSSNNNFANLSPTTTSTNPLSPTATATNSLTPAVKPTGVFNNFIPPLPSQIPLLYNDCESLNGTVRISPQNTRFKVTCPLAILGSEAGATGSTLTEVVAYTLDDCITACSLMNFWKGSSVCVAVTWDNGMADATKANSGGNCWLFNSVSVTQVKGNSTSARLQI